MPQWQCTVVVVEGLIPVAVDGVWQQNPASAPVCLVAIPLCNAFLSRPFSLISEIVEVVTEQEQNPVTAGYERAAGSFVPGSVGFLVLAEHLRRRDQHAEVGGQIFNCWCF